MSQIDLSRISWQRCFTIDRTRLDQALVKLNMADEMNLAHYSADYIFLSADGKFFDLVVNGYGDPSAFKRNDIVNFMEKLK